MKQQTENQIQAAFFDWLALHEKKYPELGLFYAIPNGANKSPAARGLFKRTGLKAGVPDVHLPISAEGYDSSKGNRGLWIEFKSQKGRLGWVQVAWINLLRQHGHRVEVCRSWTDAANITIDYLNLSLEKL